MLLHPLCLNEEGSVLHHAFFWYRPVSCTLLLMEGEGRGRGGGGEREGRGRGEGGEREGRGRGEGGEREGRGRGSSKSYLYMYIHSVRSIL